MVQRDLAKHLQADGELRGGIVVPQTLVALPLDDVKQIIVIVDFKTQLVCGIAAYRAVCPATRSIVIL